MEQSETIRYYWCVRCGHHGDLGKDYKIKKSCESCNYDDITGFSVEEIKDDESLCLEKFKKTK